MTGSVVGVIPRMCQCEPVATERRVVDGAVHVVCTSCGAEALSLSGALPEWIRDRTSYRVSLLLTPAVLKQHLGLIKEESGLSTPQLMAMAREARTLVLKEGAALGFHYKLRDYHAAGLPVEVEPAYPHLPER